MGGESGLSHESVQSEEELAMRDLIAGVDALSRPKLIDVSIPDRPREIKLCVLVVWPSIVPALSHHHRLMMLKPEPHDRCLHFCA